MSSPSRRLREQRLRLGKTESQIASAAGVPLNTYYDAEVHDSDIYMSLSIAELQRIAHAVGLRAADLLLEKGESGPAKLIDFNELAETLREYLRSHGLALSSFEERAGWELSAFLEHPSIAWEWNVDCLRDVCRELGLDWRAALPD